MLERPATLGELRTSGYRPQSVKAELRKNLLRKLRAGEALFPGILGYEDTVVPQVQNAILSQHDILFLGLRGQGKTRMLRMLVQLLDEWMPVVAGSELHDDPLSPLSRFARDRVRELGDATPIDWVHNEDRYHEKLATPDVTIADLIGEIDLVKHAEGRHLASEDVLHFGLIPRSHRGIFAINELPDLSPKIQVGLFNVLEERDIQIRGFPIRLNLDVCLVFSANPEDYTNRGRIVTPLKDRIGSVIRTHYPLSRDLGIQISDQNAWAARDAGCEVIVPQFLKEIVEETSRLARTSPHVNQASGVSVRMSIANLENLISNAERRGLTLQQSQVVARPSDLQAAIASSRGKLELTLSEEPGQEDKLISRLIEEATKNVFDARWSAKQFKAVSEFFDQGQSLEFNDHLPSAKLLEQLSPVRGFRQQLSQLAKELEPMLASGTLSADFEASVAELILDGLYCNNRIQRKAKGGMMSYGA